MVGSKATKLTDDTAKSIISYDIPSIDHSTNLYVVDIEMDSNFCAQTAALSATLMKLQRAWGSGIIDEIKKTNKSDKQAMIELSGKNGFGDWVDFVNELVMIFKNTPVVNSIIEDAKQFSKEIEPSLNIYVANGYMIERTAISKDSDKGESKYWVNTNSRGLNKIEMFDKSGNLSFDYLVILENILQNMHYYAKIEHENIKIKKLDGTIADSVKLKVQWEFRARTFFDQDVVFNPNYDYVENSLYPNVSDRKYPELPTSFTRAERAKNWADKSQTAPFIGIGSLISSARASFSRSMREDKRFTSVNKSVFILPSKMVYAPNIKKDNKFERDLKYGAPTFDFEMEVSKGEKRWIINYLGASVPSNMLISDKEYYERMESPETFEEILVSNYAPSFTMLKTYISKSWPEIKVEYNKKIAKSQKFDVSLENIEKEVRSRFEYLKNIMYSDFGDYYAMIKINADEETLRSLAEFMSSREKIERSIAVLQAEQDRIRNEISRIDQLKKVNVKTIEKRINKLTKDYEDYIRGDNIYSVFNNSEGWKSAEGIIKFRFRLEGKQYTKSDISKIKSEYLKFVDSERETILKTANKTFGANIDCLDWEQIVETIAKIHKTDLEKLDEVEWDSPLFLSLAGLCPLTISMNLLFHIAGFKGLDEGEPIHLLIERVKYENGIVFLQNIVKNIKMGYTDSCLEKININKGSSKKKGTSKKKSTKKADEKKPDKKTSKKKSTKKANEKKVDEKKPDKKTSKKKSTKKANEKKVDEKKPDKKTSKKKSTKKANEKKVDEKKAEVEAKKKAEAEAKKKAEAEAKKKAEAEAKKKAEAEAKKKAEAEAKKKAEAEAKKKAEAEAKKKAEAEAKKLTKLGISALEKFSDNLIDWLNALEEWKAKSNEEKIKFKRVEKTGEMKFSWWLIIMDVDQSTAKENIGLYKDDMVLTLNRNLNLVNQKFKLDLEIIGKTTAKITGPIPTGIEIEFTLGSKKLKTDQQCEDANILIRTANEKRLEAELKQMTEKENTPSESDESFGFDEDDDEDESSFLEEGDQVSTIEISDIPNDEIEDEKSFEEKREISENTIDKLADFMKDL